LTYGIFTTFDSLNLEFHPGSRLIDIFSSHISFHNANHSFNKWKKAYCMKLDEIALKLLSDPKSVIIITDTSVKNNIAFSISYVHSFNNLLKKTLINRGWIISHQMLLWLKDLRVDQWTEPCIRLHKRTQ